MCDFYSNHHVCDIDTPVLTFSFLVHHHCLSHRAHGKCPCWVKLGLDDFLHYNLNLNHALSTTPHPFPLYHHHRTPFPRRHRCRHRRQPQLNASQVSTHPLSKPAPHLTHLPQLSLATSHPRQLPPHRPRWHQRRPQSTTHVNAMSPALLVPGDQPRHARRRTLPPRP